MRRRRRSRRDRAAFTLLEVVVSVGGCALVALLLVGAIGPLSRQLSESAAAGELEAVLAEVRHWMTAEAGSVHAPLRSALAEGPQGRFLYRERRLSEGQPPGAAVVGWTMGPASALRDALDGKGGTGVDGAWLYLLEVRALEPPGRAGRLLPYEARLWRVSRPAPGTDLGPWREGVRRFPPTCEIRGVTLP